MYPESRNTGRTMDYDRETIIPPARELWPLELVIADQLAIEDKQKEEDMFERLEIERAYNRG